MGQVASVSHWKHVNRCQQLTAKGPQHRAGQSVWRCSSADGEVGGSLIEHEKDTNTELFGKLLEKQGATRLVLRLDQDIALVVRHETPPHLCDPR